MLKQAKSRLVPKLQAKPTENFKIQSEATDETSISKLTPCEEAADILAP